MAAVNPIVDESRRRFGARDALLCVLLAALVLLLAEGSSIRRTGEEMDPGWERDLVLAVGEPAGWLADRLPLADASEKVTSWLSPDDDLGGQAGGFEGTQSQSGGASGDAVPPVTPDAFDPATVGERPPRPRALKTLLVTGDSMAMPLDVEVARRLAGREDVEVERDPHVGTGISKSALVDWAKLSASQVAEHEPEAVVAFIGANEGFPMKVGGRDVACCGRVWSAEFAFRVRRMMHTYRQRGAARVYWLTLPMPRDPDRARIARSVNAAIAVAADAYRTQVRVLDMSRIFTPGGRYRDAMDVGGRETIVRESDGIHLNGAGARLAADVVLGAVRRDFGG
jgi:hypothetical protein